MRREGPVIFGATRLVWLKPGVLLGGLVPLAYLARRFQTGALGADPVAAALNELGLTALVFLAATLACTPLKAMLGWTWPMRLRRMLGLFAFAYLLLHFLTWLILDQDLYWSGILVDIGKRPFITIGFAALLLLVPLAVTSTNGMMRRLGRRWKTLHRLVYLIVLLGIWHYYWQVKADVREPLIYLGIAVVLLGWRVYKKFRATSRQSSSDIAPGTLNRAPRE